MKKVFKTILIVLVAILVISCDLFKSQDNRKVIVRVNNSYLYEEDINSLVGEGISAEDSAIIVNSYINRWATQQLLIDRAKLNLPEARQKEFNELVENYKNELYTNAYTEAIVSKEMDSVFADTLISNYYEEHKENFKLGQDLVKLRYINLEANNTNFDKIKDWFIRFNDKDKVKLQENALQFKNYSFNDSVWIKTTTVYEKVTPLSVGDRAKLLQKDKYIELKDSLETYLIYVNDALKKNDQAPLEYAKPTVEQILLNKQKLELVKQLEKDITKDAIKNNQFEIYN
ncbi:peptidyl-prolyl cis-trans isomerase [Zunongwangia profunda]|uniref:Peptidylprolyl isomerase n=1 Tax=Zunongwangia profunda TaxID=398743 RepID=A0A3D5J6J2_9FLAO|nr:peptidyl-prolyl cis-trans isomerase [Zunongwangia profunda]HAJ82536.1 peptidylprolyl isomerase [Zunongwangia profunda]HCV83032.1 peptidylprolyl isomerase [Zunongwangia profunda]